MAKILYGILYLLLTSFLVYYLFFDNNYLNNRLEDFRENLVRKLTVKFEIREKARIKRISSFLDWVQTILIALILVFIIQYFYLGNYTVPTSSMYPTIKPGERFFADKVSYKFREPERGEILVFKEPFLNKERYTKRLSGLPGETVQIKDNSVHINGVSYPADRDYYNSNTLQGEEAWKVPEKGDSIKLEDGLFRIKGYLYPLDLLRERLKEEPGLLKEIFIVRSKFVLNGNISTGPIYDRDILLKLINGEELVLDNDYYYVLGDNSGNSLDSRYWGFVSEKRIMGKMMFRFWPIKEIGTVK
ncbi:MAG: signal peptidase I [Halanaerobiales bacterium]